MNRSLLLKITHILITGTGSTALAVVLFQMLGPLDAVIYASSYATGQVKSGLWTQAQAQEFFLHEAIGWLAPFVLPIVSIVLVAAILWTILSLVEQSNI